MAQTILTVVAEIDPVHTAAFRERLVRINESLKGAQSPYYSDFLAAVPTLHFMSMTVVTDARYDPIFVLEANFDGGPRPFWARLEAALGAELRELLRWCKRPRDGRGELYDRATAAGSTAPLAPLLEALTVDPVVKHQGNRGLSRERIEREGELFLAARAELEAMPGLPQLSEDEIHARLRAALAPRFGWLDAVVGPRVTLRESVADGLGAAAFAGKLLLVFAPLGMLLAWLSALAFPSLRAGLLQGFQVAPTAVPAVDRVLSLLLTLAGGLLLAGLLGLIASLPFIAAALRRLERCDAVQLQPPLDEAALQAMARAEDQIGQNHMISVVHLKPGLLRAALARFIFGFLEHYLRLTARNGYLASMRTIHFAHWALLDNGGRLMFHSNFDGTWESYLDDFIEKAHAGLTLAWTHGVGFPPTRWLALDGATHGRLFKAWARHSMTPCPLWISAYKTYSVNQIERHARVAQGLRRRRLSTHAARAWVLDL